LCSHFIIPVLPLIILKINYFINNLLLTVILKTSFVLNHYLKKNYTYLIFLILHLTTILKIYIFVMNLNFNFLKIKKCEYIGATTPVCSLVIFKRGNQS